MNIRQKIVWVGGMCLLTMSCKTELSYHIEGEFTGAPEGILVYMEQDSALIQDGKFVFQGKVDFPKLSSLRIKGTNEYGMPDFKGTLMWLENADMKVVCDYKDLPDYYRYSDRVKLTGSVLNDQYNGYRKELASLGLRDSLWKIYQQVYLIPSFEWKGVDVRNGSDGENAETEFA